jgi:molybdate transport system regulatory protein
MPSLQIRIGLDPNRRIGPGKIELLEKIAALGSISAAGRAMGMSYRRAWELVDEIQEIFGREVAVRRSGGRHGGGARLTPLGDLIVSRFRAIEKAAFDAAQPDIEALQKEVRKGRRRERLPLIEKGLTPARSSGRPSSRGGSGRRSDPEPAL